MTLQLLCGTDPFPTDFRAKKYKLHKHFITKEDFQQIMRSLPLPVSEADIEEMFSFADKNKDGKLSYKEFEVNGHLIYFDIISKFFKDDDRSPDPSLGVQAPHYRHRPDPPGVQSSGQAGGPVKLCLSNTAGLQGDVLLAELPGQLQADQLGQLHHGENRFSHLKLHQHCKYLK